MELTSQEKYLIELLRELKPFEKVEITKDKEGKPNCFLVKREQKILLTELLITPVK